MRVPISPPLGSSWQLLSAVAQFHSWIADGHSTHDGDRRLGFWECVPRQPVFAGKCAQYHPAPPRLVLAPPPATSLHRPTRACPKSLPVTCRGVAARLCLRSRPHADGVELRESPSGLAALADQRRCFGVANHRQQRVIGLVCKCSEVPACAPDTSLLIWAPKQRMPATKLMNMFAPQPSSNCSYSRVACRGLRAGLHKAATSCRHAHGVRMGWGVGWGRGHTPWCSAARKHPCPLQQRVA